MERTAQEWANVIRNGAMRHNVGVYPDRGENLAMFGGSKRPSWTKAHQLWIDEKKWFRNGIFPDVSTTGKWKDVGHYTAMMWRETTHVGCAGAQGARDWKFVCHYKKHPNIIGERTY